MPEINTTLGPVHGHSLDLATIGLPEKTIHAVMGNKTLAYLLANGFSQSITDAGAFGKADEAKLNGRTKESVIAERRASRLAAIVAGTVSAGGSRGPMLKGLDSFIFDQAVKTIEAQIVAWNKSNPSAAPKTMPRGKGAADMVRTWVEKLKTRPVWPEVVKAAEAAYAASQAGPTADSSVIDALFA